MATWWVSLTPFFSGPDFCLEDFMQGIHQKNNRIDQKDILILAWKTFQLTHTVDGVG